MLSAVQEISADRLEELLEPLARNFGFQVSPGLAQVTAALGHDERFAILDEGKIVACLATYPFELTVPNEKLVPIAAVTMVAVLATHRRRGLLRKLIQHCFERAHARGTAVSALFATENAIYTRFGYGVASWGLDIEIDREHMAITAADEQPRGRFRLLTPAQAAADFPAVWAKLRPQYPGLLSRTPAWWQHRRVTEPEWRTTSRSPLQNVLYEVDGEPQAYAIYRLSHVLFAHGLSAAELDVVEAAGVSPASTRAIWQYLFGIDLTRKLRAYALPTDHPLPLWLREPAGLKSRRVPGLQVRLLDVQQALALRERSGSSAVRIQVRDSVCPWNEGTYVVTRAGVERTTIAPELTLDVEVLGSVYLGAFRFADWFRAGRVEEHSPGAVAAADDLFTSRTAPWCPDIF